MLAGYYKREKINEEKGRIWDKRIGWLISWLLSPYMRKGKNLLPEKCEPKWEYKKTEKKTPFESRNELKKLKKELNG